MTLYRERIKTAEPIGKFINNRFALWVHTLCADTDRKAIDLQGHNYRLYGDYVRRLFAPWIDGKPPKSFAWFMEYFKGLSQTMSTASVEDLVKMGGACFGGPATCARVLQSAADALNAKGYRTSTASPFTITTIEAVLDNRFYEGKVVYHPGQPDETVIDGLHEVPAEVRALWGQCQEIRATRRQGFLVGRPRSQQRAYPFAKVTSCARCGARYGAQWGLDKRTLERPAQPVWLPDLDRGAALLEDLPALWSHPGVDDRQREELVRQLLERVTVEGTRLVAIEPRDQYKPLFAYAALTGVRNSTPRPLPENFRGGIAGGARPPLLFHAQGSLGGSGNPFLSREGSQGNRVTLAGAARAGLARVPLGAYNGGKLAQVSLSKEDPWSSRRSNRSS